MRSKLKMLKRLRDARTRIRDAAAAEVALAERVRIEHVCKCEEIESIKEEIIVGAENRLNAAVTIAEIEMIAVEMSGADSCLDDAQEALSEAVQERTNAAQHLRHRERELRLSERLVSDVRTEISQDDAKKEQAMVDDIIASRWSQRQ